MCDEDKLSQWAQSDVSRRDFGALAGALAGSGAVAACSPGRNAFGAAGFPVPVSSRAVSFKTADGTMDGWFVHPTGGPAPGVIFWPDIAGIRDAKKAMASSLAGMGYSVLVMNQYYRDTPAPIWSSFADFAEGGWDRAREMWARLDADAIARDTVAAVKWLDAQPEVDTADGIGAQGYCMGGPFAIWSAAAVPERIRAAASFHGGGLVREGDPKSPHNTFARSQARYLIGIARDDDAKAPHEKAALVSAAKEAGKQAKVDVYAGDHGWTVPDSPAYAKAAAERAFANVVGIYTLTLKE